MQPTSGKPIHLQVDRKRLCTYLSYSGINMDLIHEQQLEETIMLAEESAHALSKYLYLDCKVASNGKIECLHTSLTLPAIPHQNYTSLKQCALFACTIGAEYERLLQRLSMTSALQTLIADSCGSTLVESLADMIEDHIAKDARKRGLYAGQRLSPGYQELDLELSSRILEIVHADTTLGIISNTSKIMIPRKSITAIMYFFSSKQEAHMMRYSCDNCSQYSTCIIRKQGKRCYKQKGRSSGDLP